MACKLRACETRIDDQENQDAELGNQFHRRPTGAESRMRSILGSLRYGEALRRRSPPAPDRGAVKWFRVLHRREAVLERAGSHFRHSTKAARNPAVLGW